MILRTTHVFARLPAVKARLKLGCKCIRQEWLSHYEEFAVMLPPLLHITGTTLKYLQAQPKLIRNPTYYGANENLLLVAEATLSVFGCFSTSPVSDSSGLFGKLLRTYLTRARIIKYAYKMRIHLDS